MRFFYQNVAVYLRCSFMLDRFNNFDIHTVFLVNIYIYKYDAYTVLFVPKLGLVVTNHVHEFYSFNFDITAVILVIISFIIIIALKESFYNNRRQLR